jgi:hypothetical protein
MKTDLNKLVGNQHLVQALWSAVNTSAGSLENVAPLVKKVLETVAWKKREVPQLGGQIVEFERFADFITTPPLRGCGWPLDKVEALIKDEQDVLTMWHQATTGEQGAHHDNVMMKAKQGTSRAYTLDRLQRKRPDLYDEVIAKRMSANAAAIAAGFRTKPTPLTELRRAWKLASGEERQAFRKEIADG